MEIAKIRVSGTRMEILERKAIPAGIQGGTITFLYDQRWEALAKTVVFQGLVTKDVVNAGQTVTIPAEVVNKPGVRLWVGIYGVEQDTVAIPTLWQDLGMVMTGADPSGDTSTQETLPVWAQLQVQLGDPQKLETQSKESLVSAVNEVAEKTGAAYLEGIIEAYLTAHPGSSGYGAVDATLSIHGAAADAGATGEALRQIQYTLYPVGTVLLRAEAVSPEEAYGGVWEQLEDSGIPEVYAWKRVTLGIAVRILVQPESVSAAYGATATVTVEAVGDGLSYAWFYRNPGAESWSRSNSTTNVFTTSMDASKNGREVYCQITDLYGNVATTDTVTVNMLEG